MGSGSSSNNFVLAVAAWLMLEVNLFLLFSTMRGSHQNDFCGLVMPKSAAEGKVACCDSIFHEL